MPMNITKFLNKVYFAPRLKEIEQYTSHAGELQQLVLQRLVRTAANTEWGKKHDYASIRTYEDFKKRLPIQTYEEVKPYVTRLRAGEQNLLWPSEIRWFAKSSGTTNDKSKFLPVSRESLHDTHYKGGRDAVAIYLGQNPESRFFSGKGLILGGSHAPNLNTNHSLVGDLSAILIENINPLVNFVRVPSKQTALMEHFEPKMEAIARETIHANVSNLSGVPSWMLVLIKHILEKTGKQSLEEIWPNLEVFFHGGVAFTPYREQYKDVIRSSKEDIQCKGASVGQSAYCTHIRFFGFGAHRKDSAGGCKEAFGCFLAGTSYNDSGEGRCSALCHNRRHGHGGCAYAESSYSARSHKKKRLPYRGAKRQHIRQTEPYRGCTCG